MKTDAPMQVVAGDTAALWAAGKYWGPALCMDLSDNGAKEEMLSDLSMGRSGDVPKAVREYIGLFNKARPSFALGYLTPAQYKERYWKPKLPAIVGKDNGKRLICVPDVSAFS